jgi:hypothetical protein
MAKKKRPQLSPEMREKYRAWLRAQRTAGINYGQDASGQEVALRTPLSAKEADGAERWLRDVEKVDRIEFEESEDDEEENTADVQKNNAHVVPGVLGQLGWTWNVLIVCAVIVAVALIITFVRR